MIDDVVDDVVFLWKTSRFFVSVARRPRRCHVPRDSSFVFVFLCFCCFGAEGVAPGAPIKIVKDLKIDRVGPSIPDRRRRRPVCYLFLFLCVFFFCFLFPAEAPAWNMDRVLFFVAVVSETNGTTTTTTTTTTTSHWVIELLSTSSIDLTLGDGCVALYFCLFCVCVCVCVCVCWSAFSSSKAEGSMASSSMDRLH